MLDAADQELYVRLQLEDFELLESASKGKSAEGRISDFEVALKLYKDELIVRDSILSDRRMTESIAQAVRSDGPRIMESMSEEERSAQDRRLALTIHGGSMSGGKEMTVEHSTEDDGPFFEENLQKLSVLYNDGVDDSSSDTEA